LNGRPGTQHDRAAGPDLAAALAGDGEAFRRLVEPYRRELHLHCYRMLGSFHDAEDAMQETWLRAWRHLATYQGRSPFRAWLYRIATNVCLSRRRTTSADRPLPKILADEVARGNEQRINLSPYPDALLNEVEATWGNPAAEYDLRESVQLAFLAAVQLLPPRQRAVLLVRDVLGYSAEETAGLLEATVASVNSALARARATLDQQRAVGRLQMGRMAPADEVEQYLVQRYVEAWQALDMGKLAALLKSNVVLTMPPLPLRYTGREAVVDFYARLPFAQGPPLRFLATRANRQPAVAVYRLDRDERRY